jgi:hypothetical protein
MSRFQGPPQFVERFVFGILIGELQGFEGRNASPEQQSYSKARSRRPNFV